VVVLLGRRCACRCTRLVCLRRCHVASGRRHVASGRRWSRLRPVSSSSRGIRSTSRGVRSTSRGIRSTVVAVASCLVVVTWHQVDGGRGCVLSRLVVSVVDHFCRRRAKTSSRRTQGVLAAEERSRLRIRQDPDVGPAVVSSFRLTVPAVPDLPGSSTTTTTTSDAASSGQLLLNPTKQPTPTDDGCHYSMLPLQR